MNNKLLPPLVVVFLAIILLVAPARASNPIYAIAGLSFFESPFNRYQVGVFDLDNPTGTFGNYEYAWSSLGGISSDPISNIAFNPATSQMYLQYNFNQFRTIETDGTIGDVSLGSMNMLWGMAFDSSANLYGTGYDNWYTLNSSTGSTLSSAPLVEGFYSQFAGGLAYAADGNFYFGSNYPDSLFQITPGGVDTEIGTFSGVDFDGDSWIAMFSAGSNTYLLNFDRLYQVDLTDASLIRLGTITGLPGNFSMGFTGATSTSVIPEPSTLSLLVLVGGAMALVRRRSR